MSISNRVRAIAISYLNSGTILSLFFRKFFRKAGIGDFTFKLATNLFQKTSYAYILYQAAQLAKKLGEPRISVIEFGVAGGRGLLCMEQYAVEIERLTGVEIEIYGFDAGDGLPPPADYRDLPYHWKAGFYVMDQDLLRSKLNRSHLIIGDINETAANFFNDHTPAPIGAISYDFDFYSSTIPAMEMLKAGDDRYLPRVYCYFDDTVGSEIELYNDYTGERLAIREFNDDNEAIKLARPAHLISGSTVMWHYQIWICHFFRHRQYNRFVSTENQQRPIA